MGGVPRKSGSGKMNVQGGRRREGRRMNAWRNGERWKGGDGGEWRGKREAAGLMDGGRDAAAMEGVWKEKARPGEFCPICSIIIQCVSVGLGEDIIKGTRGRPGSRSRGDSATLPSLLPLNLYNLPPLRVSFEKSPFDP